MSMAQSTLAGCRTFSHIHLYPPSLTAMSRRVTGDADDAALVAGGVGWLPRRGCMDLCKGPTRTRPGHTGPRRKLRSRRPVGRGVIVDLLPSCLVPRGVRVDLLPSCLVPRGVRVDLLPSCLVPWGVRVDLLPSCVVPWGVKVDLLPFLG
jgi:hypothetical protein